MIQKIDNMVICGDPVDDGALNQLIECAKLCELSAMMADHHKGYSCPIGGVMASRETFSPATVGFDIACGMKVVLTDADADFVRANISQIMDKLVRCISFGIGRTNKSSVDHSLFDSDLWKLKAAAPHKEMARNQLGTVGSGNHFCDIYVDELDRVWVGCHFGSRGLGHKIATWFLDEAGATDNMDAPPVIFHERSPIGEEYLQAIDLAGQYAYAGRDWVCEELARVVGAKIVEEVHSHHNFLWRETHNDIEYWVGRKGATPCRPGQRGLVGSSMAEPSMIIEGVDSPLSAELLHSTAHGAGRVMSRTAARGKIDRKTKEVKSPGAVTHEMMQKWVSDAKVELRGADLDESPDCYKRLPEVLAHHAGTIKIVHQLQPIGVAMASKDVFDPFKD